VAAQCCDALGVPKGTAVEAQLYKLLLYEQGSHFSVHRDTEKVENMWGERCYDVFYILPLVHTALVEALCFRLQDRGDNATSGRARTAPGA